MASILSAKDVTKRFGGLVAVDHVDMEIQEKSIHAIIGPNGAGKTTLFNCITGFYTIDDGEVVFSNRPLKNVPPDRITRRGISRTYQNIRLFSNMTAIENILVGQEPHLKSSWIGAVLGLSGAKREEEQAHEEARRLLAFVGLRGKGDILAKHLAYGDQRRLEIGRALASQPKLLLLDEPTAGMNPNETDALTNFIELIRDELGVTILLIEHDMRVVMGISEQITVLDYGQKIAEGTPKEIQSNARVIEAYLGRAATESSNAHSHLPQAQSSAG
ncbi:MAG TPA: ABC transporter ATP-binding protein [Gammaproteobacteria bacterium]|nr:ABC transporter ATP-binding protein [Gammaproteobacteria bacterium]